MLRYNKRKSVEMYCQQVETKNVCHYEQFMCLAFRIFYVSTIAFGPQIAPKQSTM